MRFRAFFSLTFLSCEKGFAHGLDGQRVSASLCCAAPRRPSGPVRKTHSENGGTVGLVVWWVWWMGLGEDGGVCLLLREIIKYGM